MKIVIPGGSGQVGTILARAFHGDGHDVVVLSRRPTVQPWRIGAWDGATLGSWQREIDGCDVVINLTGRSVNCRYTAAHREEILQSRVLSTRVVGQAIARAPCPPRVWLQASTATILKSRRVIPAKLLEHGFTFRYPNWSDAARDLCDRWRVTASGSAAA
jgi:hypothetical protein